MSKAVRGDGRIELVLWVFGIFPGLVYHLWRRPIDPNAPREPAVRWRNVGVALVVLTLLFVLVLMPKG